jgi:HlyD family secretion protein
MRTDGSRWLTWGSGVAFVVAILAWTLWPNPEPVDVATVIRAPLVVTLDEEGETRVREKFSVSAPVEGRLLRIELEPGDPVVAGETVLAIFQPREATLLDARTRAEREAEVLALEAEFEQERHRHASAQAELEFAAREFSRARRLAKEEIFSAERLESAELAERRAIENVEASEHAVGSATYRLASARARLLNAGDPIRSGDDPISIYAPIDGAVLRRHRESETIVAAGEPLVEVGNIEELEIVADYLSIDAVRIHPGARAIVEGWGGDAPLEARVRRIEPSGFTKISALGVEEQRVNVVLDLVSPLADRRGLADGYRVETRIVAWEREDALQVATGSLFRRGEGWAVFVVEDGRARLRPVEIGARTPATCEVLAGLEVDEVVITHPSDRIVDGGRVTTRSFPY